MIVVDFADALIVNVRVPVLASGVDDGAEQYGPGYGSERVHEKLLEAESDRVHFARVHTANGDFQIGQKGQRVEKHQQGDARKRYDESEGARLASAQAVGEIGVLVHLAALVVGVVFLLKVRATGQTRRLEEYILGVFETHRFEYFRVARTVRGRAEDGVVVVAFAGPQRTVGDHVSLAAKHHEAGVDEQIHE